MTNEEIEKRLEDLRAVKGDDEMAHAQEDRLSVYALTPSRREIQEPDGQRGV